MQSVTLVFILAAAVSACPIPVFRYALEYWEPDPYRLTVYHGESLSAEEQAVVRKLKDLSSLEGVGANIELTLVDVSIDDGSLHYRPYIEAEMPELPWMTVRYPYITGNEDPLWSGVFNAGNTELLIKSPARAKASELLSEGIKVWILLESGDRSKDRAAREILERELSRLEQTMDLPDTEQWFTGSEGIPEPEIKFRLLTVSRQDPLERFFVKMLLNSEDDLAGFSSEPIVFPLYGRGIALWGIVGGGINVWNITDAAEFLIGPCSCQVKMLNPGVDMLFTEDWTGRISKITDWMLTPITGFSEFEERGEAVRRILEEESDAERRSAADGDGLTLYVDIFGEGSPIRAAEEIEAESPEKNGRALFPAIFIIAAAVVIIAGLAVFKIKGNKG